MRSGVSQWRGRLFALLGILVFAFSLRVAVASLSPVLTIIAEEFPLPSVVIGLIATAPPVCYAIFGIVTPMLERRFGLERLVVAAIVITTVGMVLRVVAPGALTLLLGTALLFAGVGMGNVLLPPAVKRYFPDRIGLLTTLYTSAMAIATFSPPLLAVPIADASSWRASLGVWVVFSLASFVPWTVLLSRRRAMLAAAADEADAHVATAPAGTLSRMLRLPLAWALLALFAVSSSMAYSAFGWWPVILIEMAGVTPATAGLLLSLFAFIGLPCSLLVPILVTRFRPVVTLVIIAVAGGVAGLAGMLLAAETAPWLWTILFGFSGLFFPLSLVLLNVHSASHEGAVALSAFVQSGGYAIAAVFPVVVGILHDATGAWTLSLVTLLVWLLVALPAGVLISRSGTVEEEWARRRGSW